MCNTRHCDCASSGTDSSGAARSHSFLSDHEIPTQTSRTYPRTSSPSYARTTFAFFSVQRRGGDPPQLEGGVLDSFPAQQGDADEGDGTRGYGPAVVAKEPLGVIFLETVIEEEMGGQFWTLLKGHTRDTKKEKTKTLCVCVWLWDVFFLPVANITGGVS